MEWVPIAQPHLSQPVLPSRDQLVLAYAASRNTFGIGYYRAGSWQLQPPVSGPVTHWCALAPPAPAAPSPKPMAHLRETTSYRPIPGPGGPKRS